MHEDQPKGETFDCHWHERYVEKDAELARCEGGLSEWKARAEKAEARLQVGLALVRDATSDAEETEARAERLADGIHELIEYVKGEAEVPVWMEELRELADASEHAPCPKCERLAEAGRIMLDKLGEWDDTPMVLEDAAVRAMFRAADGLRAVLADAPDHTEPEHDAADGDDAASREWYG